MDMIKGIKKRFGCFLLACSLSFGICATDYLEVQALEWAGTVIGLEEALKFLLGLIGVTVGVGVAETVDWQSMRENCIDFQIAQGQSSVAVSNWWADVIHGSLDTASSCWASFKEWVKTDLLSNNSSSDVISSSPRAVLNNLGIEPHLNTSKSFNFSETDFDTALNIVSAICIYNSDGTVNQVSILCNPFTVNTVFLYGSGYSTAIMTGWDVFVFNVGSIYNSEPYRNVSVGHITQSNINSAGNEFRNFSIYSKSTNYKIFNRDTLADLVSQKTSDNNFLNLLRNASEWVIDGSNVSDGVMEGAFPNVTDVALAPSIATDLPFEGVIDIPWENVGATDEAVGEAIDNAQEKVITGEWTLDQYCTWVQNVTNVFAYDITNNYLLPNDGNNETADDKVQENVNRGAFVLAGLEKVFPFCIPWDIYAFVTLLVSDPVAPVIEYPIYNPVTKDEEVITIDFSVWEQQVIIMRYIMDFLLIIGLLLLARSLIGAGGSD